MSNKLSKLQLEAIKGIEAKTDAQSNAFKMWNSGHNLVLSGAAGTGKTFIALYLALQEVLDGSRPQKKIIVVRSIVPTRDIGFLKGDEDEKIQVYKAPYIDLVNEITGDRLAWEKLEANNQIEFMPTSFVRGKTWNDSIVITDEMQNLSFHELDSVITRVGQSTRIIFAGDYYQSDFTKETDKKGLHLFLSVIEYINTFEKVEFEWKDIVRSDLVRDYIVAKETKKRKGEIPLDI